MAKIIDGKAVSAAVRAGAKQEVEALKARESSLGWRW